MTDTFMETADQQWTRRDVLKRAGQGLLTASLASNLVSVAKAQGAEMTQQIQLPLQTAKTDKQTSGPPTPLPPINRVGYAIVGLGKLALEEILPAFAECKKSKPVALVSGDAAKANQVASEYGIDPKNIYNYQNYDTIADNPAVDVIYVVLPNSMHLEYTVRGAKAGKHILCEKPMANSVSECQQMIDACNKANKKLMIAYRMQYEPYNRELIRMTRTREFGPAKIITAENGQDMTNPEQWRLKKSLSGGGSLPDVGIYCLNATRYLTGEEPIEISAFIHTTPNDPRFREVEENVSFQLRFPSGILANCSTSYGIHEARRLRIFAETGWYGLEPAFAYNGLQMRVGHATPKTEIVEERHLEDKNQFATEIDHMSECVMQNKMPHTPGEEGMQDIKLIAAIYEAARTGRPVKLPEVERLDAFRGPLDASS